MEYVFNINMKVRSYECDLQGVVNNAVYLNYLEYARCEWLKTMGLNYIELCRQKQYLYVSSVEINYKNPLFYDDDFTIYCGIRRESNIRLVGQQDIFRDKTIILKAGVQVIGVNEQSKDKFRLPDTLINKLPEDSRL